MKKINFYFVLSLLVFCSCSKKAEKIGDNDVDQNQVIPDFSWTGNQIAPAEITFTNHTKNATSHHWDFSNGTTSTLAQPSKVTFTEPGAYTVTLRATNSSNNVFTSKVVLITENDNPVASFSYTFKNKVSYAPATVQFHNESVNAKTYEWDINGRKDYVQSPLDYIFSLPGTYKAKLIAINGTQRSTVFEKDIIVESNPNPVAKFAIGMSPGGYFVGQEIYCVNQSTNSESYLWNFGVNSPAEATSEHAIAKFDKPGVHTITLTAKKNSLSSSRSINIMVKALP